MAHPRVVHLTTTDVSLDWLLAPQLAAFRDAGFEVVAMSAPGAHVESIEAAGIEHVPITSFTRRMDLRSDLLAARELVRALDRLRPEILHTHNPKPGVIGRLVGHRVGVPIVVNTVHGLYAQPDDRLRRRLPVYGAEALALRFSDMELVQNIEDITTLRMLGASPRKTLHLGNGIDLERFRPSAPSRARGRRLRRSLGIDRHAVVVGMVGRMVWEKGYREFFNAIEALRRRGDTATEFVVAGPFEPGKAGSVDAETAAAMQAGGVHMLGQRDDVEHVYAGLDIVVLPSHREGVPRTLMEAAAMGLPAVATDIRGCRQVVVDDETGVLVPVRDSESLAEAIEALVESPTRRRDLGRSALARARQHFDQQRVIDLTLGVYRNQLRSAGLTPPDSAASIDLRYKDSSSSVDLAASNAVDASAAA